MQRSGGFIVPRTIGVISQINRYPVKSFAGERLDACQVEEYGLHGDRFCAFYDKSKSGWDSYFTARDVPEMLAYKARLVDGGIEVTSPDGRRFGWDADLLAEIQPYAARTMSMTAYRAPNPVDPSLMSVDIASVLLVTDASLRKLEAIWGKQLDSRRFRPSLIVTLDEDAVSEADWIGGRLAIGDEVELRAYRNCQRCSMITIDPDTLAKDPSLLRKVNEELRLNFGVYASVMKTGQVQVGDKVALL